jgi:DNA-binding response OmpR family regulator
MRLLVVEDEPAMADALCRGLRADGFAVDVAVDGVAGLDLARDGGYDAILLDVMLPGLSGYRVCQELRAERNWVPVLMLSAKDGEYDQADGLDVGADDYLTKPFSYVVLLARLRALLRRGVRPRPVTYTCGDLVVDPATHTVRRGDDVVPLTTREFAVVEYLIRHQGQVVGKQALYDHVWESPEGNLNTVEVYVRYLRRKLDEPYGRHSIRTVRGGGYQLVAD